ncbi:GL13425 [Drosophila persimilis]|uniref:GL13425 n=2 Tax=Drosophila persimilis TaxID=7234 RepID=B4H2Y6_DROPE|nr:GL13425 [Drosophila persimilis]
MVVNGRSLFGLDAEIPDIRDEDQLMRQDVLNSGQGKRPGTATSRLRPTTGRSRKGTGAGASASAGGGRGGGGGGRAARAAHNGRNVPPGSSMLNSRDDDSSFGSSDSELDVGEIMGMSGIGAGAGGISMAMGTGDDDFDLNSIDDISISKLTGELPLRPKTANKAEHHSDEDF